MDSRLVALGDSISCGEGIGVSVGRAHTWVGVLAHATDTELLLLAGRGARTSDVRRRQLPLALRSDPALATLLVGLNDMVSGQFDAEAVREDLLFVVAELRASGIPVLLARLYDPTAILPTPIWLRHKLLRRVGAINAAVHAARGPGVHVLDLDRVPVLRTRAGWAVDRVHPSVAGHRGIAAAASALLRERGVMIPKPVPLPQSSTSHTRLAEVRWLARHGAPYLVRKATNQNVQDWVGTQ